MTIKEAVFVYHLRELEEMQWHSRFHYHGSDEYEVHYFLGGQGSFLNGNQKFVLEPGSLFISPPRVRHRIEASDTDDPISYYALLLQIDVDDEARILLEQKVSWQRCYRIGNTYRFFFEELREKALSTAAYMQMSAVHQLVSFLYLLIGGDGDLRQGNSENIHIEKALRYMQNSVFKGTTLKSLAGRLRISEEHLIRLFRQKLNTTPMKYLTKLRIEAATSMLISSDLYVYQIAERLQFNSEFHFSRVFKKYTGRSPKNYRNLYRQLIGQSSEHEAILYINTQ